jgi:(2Fe-2S) ferredoxin
MDIQDAPHACHLFVCGHQRADGRPSCGQGWDAPEACARLKALLRERGLPVRVTQTGCLGPCAEGPNVLAHPPGIWFRRADLADLPAVADRVEAFIRSAGSPPGS